MKRETFVLVLIVAVAAFFRFYRLDSAPPGLHKDEATDGNDAMMAWRSGRFQVFYPENFGREGLVINLQALVLGLTGCARPWALRVPSAALGVLTVLGTGLLARKLGLQRMAWFAAALLAASFWHIAVSRMGTRVSAAPFFLVWSWWLLCRAQGPRWIVWSALSGLIYGLGFYSYTAFRLTPLLVVIVAQRMEKRAVIVASFAALLTMLPLAIVATRQPGMLFQRALLLPGSTAFDLGRNFAKMAGMFNIAGDPNPRHNIAGRPMLWWPVGLLFLAGIVVAARRQRVLLWWLVIAMLPAVLANEAMPHSWRSVLAVPAACILAALGMEWIAERFSFLRCLAPILAVTVAVEVYRSYFLVWARDPRVAAWFDSSLLNFAAQLEELPRELPKYVIFDPGPVIVRGFPLPAQTIMFLTDTATPDRQKAKNLYYLWPNETNKMARGYVYVGHIGSSTDP